MVTGSLPQSRCWGWLPECNGASCWDTLRQHWRLMQQIRIQWTSVMCLTVASSLQFLVLKHYTAKIPVLQGCWEPHTGPHTTISSGCPFTIKTLHSSNEKKSYENHLSGTTDLRGYWNFITLLFPSGLSSNMHKLCCLWVTKKNRRLFLKNLKYWLLLVLELVITTQDTNRNPA